MHFHNNELSNLYANLIEEENIQFDVIYGPAYKGIPLAAGVATIISGRTSNLVSISFDRKEEKTHGEGGKIVGSVKGKKVLILGAGGVVPSIIFALKKMGVSEIIVSNRTRQKAENLKKTKNYVLISFIVRLRKVKLYGFMVLLQKVMF